MRRPRHTASTRVAALSRRLIPAGARLLLATPQGAGADLEPDPKMPAPLRTLDGFREAAALYEQFKVGARWGEGDVAEALHIVESMRGAPPPPSSS